MRHRCPICMREIRWALLYCMFCGNKLKVYRFRDAKNNSVYLNPEFKPKTSQKHRALLVRRVA